MKFEFNKDKFVDLGLIVKHGNMQNIVMFWDENKNAASYILEIYRINWDYKVEGFFEEANVLKRNYETYINGERVIKTDDYLSKTGTVIVENKFAFMREWVDNSGQRSEIIYYKLDNAKPVCTVIVERNKFYHSINDLPYGDYIVCLKAEDRSGEVCAESAPYYFHIADAENFANKRASNIARASRRNWVDN